MMKTLVVGQKIGVQELCRSHRLTISVELSYRGEIDVSCFGVDAQGMLADERYFVFYNQLSSPEGAVVKQEGNHCFDFDLDRLPPEVERLVLTAAIDGEGSMALLGASRLLVQAEGLPCAEYVFDGASFQKQKAIILIELYRRNDLWRLSVVGNGFDGGLGALLAHFGGEEAQQPQSPQPQLQQAVAAPKVSLTKGEAVQQVVLAKAPRLSELTKKAVVSLEKKQLADVRAQVVLVLDASGSMNWQYSQGRVQRLLDKVLPLALMFDDDGVLECWAFASHFQRLADASIDNIDDYIEQANGGWEEWNIGWDNNEPEVIRAIYDLHKDDALPVYVIFVSDGGIYLNDPIKDLIKKAAKAPIFWQFVGIGGSGYGVLEKLDKMWGRYVDNANFFALDDIDSISDEALYDRLMGEFPLWLREAKSKRILR